MTKRPVRSPSPTENPPLKPLGRSLCASSDSFCKTDSPVVISEFGLPIDSASPGKSEHKEQTSTNPGDWLVEAPKIAPKTRTFGLPIDSASPGKSEHKEQTSTNPGDWLVEALKLAPKTYNDMTNIPSKRNGQKTNVMDDNMSSSATESPDAYNIVHAKSVEIKAFEAISAHLAPPKANAVLVLSLKERADILMFLAAQDNKQAVYSELFKLAGVRTKND
jgi:hypothetical protein